MSGGSSSHSSYAGTSIYSSSNGTGLQVSSTASGTDSTAILNDFPLNGAQIDGFGHDNMMMNHIIAELTHLTREDPDEEDSTSTGENATPQITVVRPASHSKSVEGQDRNAIIGLWKGSPIHLLNSSVASQLLNLSLGEVYNSMMLGITTRYLDYNCNLFACSSYKYVFESEDLGQPSALSSEHVSMSSDPAAKSTANTRRSSTFLPLWRKSNHNFRPDTLYNHTLSTKQVATQTSRVTMIGVARFLDNFGPLYGNSVEQEIRKQDELALTAVLQAFALQFAPSDPRSCPLESKVARPQNAVFGSRVKEQTTNSTQVFTAAWHHAYLNLLSTKDNRSFVHIYAVFLFQMTVVPSESLVSKDVKRSPLDLLDVALSQMEELRQLVQAYYSDLGAGSLYRFLLDSSLTIFRWYSLVRDSIASILHERPCYMEDPPFIVRDSTQRLAQNITEQWQQPSTFEQDVAKNCQNAAGDLFHIFRQLTHLKQFISTINAPTDHARMILLGRIESAINLTEGFDTIYQPWLQQCIIMFYRFSDRIKLSTAFLHLFWNLSHLCLVEQIHYASHLFEPGSCEGLISTADRLQEAAVTSVLAIARRIVDVSARGEFKLINSVQAKLQLVSHHANTRLVVMALVKAIEHTIDLNLSKHAVSGRKEATSTQPKWISSIKPLLTCLVMLDSTVSGSFTARPALRGLMLKYGDILMDCWSSEDSEHPP
ncbi:uncharacterized protein A1O9_07956 [Exophiala aquamarina CBS 119918]|uniref:Transcription factor domain-containing protein n=1 Tax=Exophiala aquamarina CBS 119918 TaxID=1182545 RepID=A0A072PLI4_9EURO|nr:uncharacterized protein A1O9_07956 [Exophiala aquamarina CBS 119918]KEF56375.1 hypothetical protein A1O9_07956 [Exophiala aquamarina CBS 119918]